MFDLTGKNALVTGSSRGIGKALALGLAGCGANVALHYRGNEKAALETADRIREMGLHTACTGADLSRPEGADSLYAAATAALGDIDILILNASVQIRKSWVEITASEYREQMDANLWSSLRLIQLAAPAMNRKGWGRIVTVGSVQQRVPHPDMVVYGASKSALLHMSENLAKQLAPAGITVNHLSPGVIDTDRNADALSDPAYREKVLRGIPLGFIGETADCVAAALLLCSHEGRYITGADLYVDGGMKL